MIHRRMHHDGEAACHAQVLVCSPETMDPSGRVHGSSKGDEVVLQVCVMDGGVRGAPKRDEVVLQVCMYERGRASA